MRAIWVKDKNSWEFPGDHEKDWKDYQELQEDAAGLKDDEVVVRFMFELCKRETKYEFSAKIVETCMPWLLNVDHDDGKSYLWISEVKRGLFAGVTQTLFLAI